MIAIMLVVHKNHRFACHVPWMIFLSLVGSSYSSADAAWRRVSKKSLLTLATSLNQQQQEYDGCRVPERRVSSFCWIQPNRPAIRRIGAPHRKRNTRMSVYTLEAVSSNSDIVVTNNQPIMKHPAWTTNHACTICMVPPPTEENQLVWDAFERARTEFRDPGLFRWPPHANLLYPFVDIWSASSSSANAVLFSSATSTTESWASSSQSLRVECEQQENQKKMSKSSTFVLDPDIVRRLAIACRDIKPFLVRLDRIGTFGGKRRGVLWVYPNSISSNTSWSRDSTSTDSETDSIQHDNHPEPTGDEQKLQSPLMDLQSILEEQFPMCATLHKLFSPHMTITHTINLDIAQQAQKQLEDWWLKLGNESIEFWVDRIYLLARKGDDGQFVRVAEILLGQEDQSSIIQHEPWLPFPSMPTEEVDWVRHERMLLKSRRNNNKR